MKALQLYYLIATLYCMFFVIKKNLKQGHDTVIGVTPALDMIMVLVIGWALAPVDLVLRIRTLLEGEHNEI